MHLKGALHTHTTCSDGEMTVAECLDAHRELGFDFVALTDHDYLMRPGCYDAVPDLAGELVVFFGVEMTVFERGYVHVNRIHGDGEQLYVFNHPAQLDLPVDKALERIDAVAERHPLDAIEITSYGFLTPEFDIPEIRYQKVATDDSHQRNMCGRAWVEMDAGRDRDSILRAIKNGDFWNCYSG